jgi:hypothetical protein
MKAIFGAGYLMLIMMGFVIYLSPIPLAPLVPLAPLAFAEERQDMASVITDAIAGHDGLSGLFSETEINDIGANKAATFTAIGTTRYALAVVRLRDGVQPKDISEPYCRSQLMTPEASVMTASLYAKTSDDMLISVLQKLWQSQGELSGSEVTTSIFKADGYAMTLCKVEDSGVTTGFVEVDVDLLTDAELLIARRLYETGDADLLHQRMMRLYDETKRPDAGAYLAMAFWLKEEYEAGFAIDEKLSHASLSDPWLKKQYGSNFDAAVEKYFAAALDDSHLDN